MARHTATARNATALLLAFCATVYAQEPLPPAQPDIGPWWHAAVQQPLGIAPHAHAITADEATAQSLAQSPDVQAIQIAPQILRTEISRQQAAFDWNNFLETSWANRSDPIGSILTTGETSGRFEDDLLTAGGGIRKKSSSGAEWELAQRSGWQRNNSTFLVPNPQSTSRLELTVTQPLLEGGGREVNYFRIVEARLLSEASESESIARLQEHVLDVVTAYWDLYRNRSSFLIRKQAADHADQLVVSLSQRRTLDATSRQILRAQTAAARRRAELMTVAAAADTAATRLRRLVGRTDYEAELIPTQMPSTSPHAYDRETAIQTALTGRPEVAKAVRDVRTASLRVGVSRNALLPRLDLIAGTYVAGLADHRNLLPAYGNQFVDGRPSVNVGLVWERPIGNRAARGLVQRRQLELQQAMADYESALQTARADIELALIRLDLTYQTLAQRRRSLTAAGEELNYLQDRWEVAPSAEGSAILLLEDLIDAQARKADEEVALSAAEADFNIALVRLHRALGTLLRPSSHRVLERPPVETSSEMILPIDMAAPTTEAQP